MDTFTAIEKRRAVKHFDPQYRFTDEEVNKILSLAVLSPTSYNIQNWRFVLVRDRELRSKIYAASWNQPQVKDASMLVILCGDLMAWRREPARYWKNSPKEVQDYIIPSILKFYEGRDDLQRDECMRSCGMAAQTIMLAAKSMGYDSCPMIGFDPAQVAQIINLPEDHIICMMVAVGKAVKEASPRGGQLPLRDVIVTDHF